MSEEYISILYTQKPSMSKFIRNLEPDFFYDLNLNQIVDSIMSERSHYNLQPYYYLLPENKETILYRQDVLKDLNSTTLLPELIHFSNLMKNAAEYLEYSSSCKHPCQKQRWYVDYVISYCEAVRRLTSSLASSGIKSAGFLKLMNYLNVVTQNKAFISAEKEGREIKDNFKTLRYGIIIEQDKVIVTLNPAGEDYCKNLIDLFGSLSTSVSPHMENPLSGAFKLSKLEENILEILTNEFPKPFSLMSEFYDKAQNITDEIIVRFENEIQFYIAFCLYKEHFELYGFHFAYPHITDGTFDINGAYDLALAGKNIPLEKPVVANDAVLFEDERFFIITGPNQGGKTTFARALGQLVYFALIGLMVPCDSASVPMFSGLATHFSVEESIESGRGKLKDELIRLRTLHKNNTKHYFVVLNELFTTAATYDSYLMGCKVLDHFTENDCFGVYVTHIKELAIDRTSAASLVAGLSDKDRHIRTYKITRRPPDGLGYAESIAEKYGMTYEKMKEVLRR